jgi:hypothetical protein
MKRKWSETKQKAKQNESSAAKKNTFETKWRGKQPVFIFALKRIKKYESETKQEKIWKRNKAKKIGKQKTKQKEKYQSEMKWKENTKAKWSEKKNIEEKRKIWKWNEAKRKI